MESFPFWSFGFSLIVLSTTLCPCLVTSSASGQQKEELPRHIEFDGKDHPSKWKLPDLQLLSADAERRENAVNSKKTETHITFKITHSSQAFVMRTGSFEFIKTTIGGPGKYDGKHVTSTVQVSVDSSFCRFEELQGKDKAEMVFGLVADKSLIVSATVDICRFHQRNVSKSKVSQKIESPAFRVLDLSSNSYDENTNEILITPGKNPQFEVDIFYPGQTKTLKIVPRLWDWKEDKLIEDAQPLSISSYDTKDTTHPLAYTVIKKVVLDGSNVALRVRVTVDIGSKKISGTLQLMFEWADKNVLDKHPVVLNSWTNSFLSLRLPYKFSVFPEGLIQRIGMDFITESNCVSENESVGFLEGKNPSNSTQLNYEIGCNAEGADIASIFVVKKSRPYMPPVKTVSYFINGIEAVSKICMRGLITDLDGSYECVVVTENGRIETKQKTTPTHVYAVTIEERGTEYYLLKCFASSSSSQSIIMNFALWDGSGNDSLINQNESKVEVLNGVAEYTAYIETDKLLFPNSHLLCIAKSELGNDEKIVDLSLAFKNYNRTAPIVLADEFRIEMFQNGTKRIYCTATGGRDVEIHIDTEGTHGLQRLDNNPGMVRLTEMRGDRKKVILDVPIEHPPFLNSEIKVYCQASNTRGTTSERVRHDNILKRE